ncbi:MAG: TlpA disulfide reductase family protein [Robiginitomaculum sp.]
MAMGKFFQNTLILMCLFVVMACSPKQDNSQNNTQSVSEITRLAQDAGKAQGIFWRDMQSQTDGMSDEKRMAWGSEGFGVWYEQNVGRSSLAYFNDFYNYGKANLSNSTGFDALLLALEVSAGTDTDYKIIQNIHELLYENYLNTPEYANILQSISSNQLVGHKPPEGEGAEAWVQARPARYKRVVKLLDRVVNTATDPTVKNHAMLGLGDYLGRSVSYMDINDTQAINKRRKRAESLLNEVIENGKKSKIPLLLNRDIPILAVYNKYSEAESGAETTAKNQPKERPEIQTPTLDELAKKMLYNFKNLSVGKSVPVTIGVDLDGNKQDFSQYKGRVVLVDFWATWCGPCIIKFPHMRELKEKYKNRPFEILGISADNAIADVTEFLEDENLPWDLWYSGKEKGVVKQWNINGFPTVFLVNHNGVIVSKNPSDEQLEAMLTGLVYEAEQAKK